MTPRILKVTTAHTDIIRQIIEEVIANKDEQPSTEHLQTLLTDDRTYLFAAVSDNTVAGYVLAYKFPSLYSSGHLAYLYDIEVVATYRRNGIGRLLIQQLLEQLKQDNVHELWLGGTRSGETFNDFTYELV
jgi:ribosomal protein S18 acetylase RimI-like enzyme